MKPVLSAAAVADLLVVVGAIARIVDDVADPPLARLASIKQALSNVGIEGRQSASERLIGIQRACRAVARRETVGAGDLSSDQELSDR